MLKRNENVNDTDNVHKLNYLIINHREFNYKSFFFQTYTLNIIIFILYKILK